MTKELLEQLNHMQQQIISIDDEIAFLEDAGKYDRLSIVGRYEGETLDHADPLCDIQNYPGLLDAIIIFMKKRKEMLTKMFEEA